MTLRPITLATMLIPFLSMSAVADEPSGFLSAPPNAVDPRLERPMSVAVGSAEIVIDTYKKVSALFKGQSGGSASLIGMTQGLDDGLRQSFGFYPCKAAEAHRDSHNSSVNMVTGSCLVAYGYGALLNATDMTGTMAFGRCSGASLRSESRDLLIGDFTAAPHGKDGFVNLENKLCFWRDTGVVETCPPPNPECLPNQPKDTK